MVLLKRTSSRNPRSLIYMTPAVTIAIHACSSNQWKKNDAGYIAKRHVVINIEQALEFWQEKTAALKST